MKRKGEKALEKVIWLTGSFMFSWYGSVGVPYRSSCVWISNVGYRVH